MDAHLFGYLALCVSTAGVVACGASSATVAAASDAGTSDDAPANDGDSSARSDDAASADAPPAAPACPAMSRPPAIAPLPKDAVTSTSWGSATGVPGALAIDLSACQNARYFASLPLGSAWVRVEANADTCGLWLGGETENPMYDGSASQYCEFARACPPTSVTIAAGQGGPPHLDSMACTP